MASTDGPVTEGAKWERHRRGRHAVLLCPGRHLRDVRERCPYTVIIAEPGHAVQEPQAAAAAAAHWTENHAGTWGDHWRANIAGQLESSGRIGK